MKRRVWRLGHLSACALLLTAFVCAAQDSASTDKAALLDARARFNAVDFGALQAAVADMAATFPEYDRAFVERLAAYEKALPEIVAGLTREDPQAVSRLEELVKFKQEALAANPLLKRRPVLFVARRQFKPDHHNTETMFQTGEINTASFEGGGALKVIDFANGNKVTTLIETAQGMVRDPEIHFDGSKIVFSMRKNIDDDYHVCEINADGSGFRQLTSAKGITDIDPLYMPDDTIVFSSTREPKYCMCNRHIMANLYRMDADGANIVQIGKSTLFEGHGALMPDGRVLYYRWEYVDRNFGDGQGLWTVNPDGTDHAVYWGNNTVSPGAVLNARPIPGTQQAVCVFSSCHDRPWGAVAVIDRRVALDGRAAVVRTWPARAIDMVGNDPDKFNFDTYVQLNTKYEDPFPLSEKYFLCSRMIGRGEAMGIYLLDVFGNETLLHFEEPGCFDPMPLGPVPRPPAIAPRRNFENKEGYFYVADVYRGTHMQGVEHGAVKYLRVIESPEKRFWTTTSWNGQGQEAPAMNWHDFNNKRILGTVPVEPDGSAYFAVPADTFVYFQLLDKDGMMIQSMRSGTIMQSGEKQGCVGCHEERRTAAPVGQQQALAALRRAPDKLDGWYGAPRMFDYMTEVQPVFDKYCVRCHDYGKPGAKAFVLAADRDLCFNTSYNELWRKKLISVIGAGIGITQPAYSWGSHASKLIEVARKRDKDIALDRESMDRLITWIDLNAPFYPEYSSAFPDNLAGRCPLDNAQVRRLAQLTGIAFADTMDCAKNLGPQVCFERPEMSPCLEKIPKDDTRYAEAVSIIQQGNVALAARPESAACPVDQRHEERYEIRKT